jgi:hypothetical protein
MIDSVLSNTANASVREAVRRYLGDDLDYSLAYRQMFRSMRLKCFGIPTSSTIERVFFDIRNSTGVAAMNAIGFAYSKYQGAGAIPLNKLAGHYYPLLTCAGVPYFMEIVMQGGTVRAEGRQVRQNLELYELQTAYSDLKFDPSKRFLDADIFIELMSLQTVDPPAFANRTMVRRRMIDFYGNDIPDPVVNDFRWDRAALLPGTMMLPSAILTTLYNPLKACGWSIISMNAGVQGPLPRVFVPEELQIRGYAVMKKATVPKLNAANVPVAEPDFLSGGDEPDEDVDN